MSYEPLRRGNSNEHEQWNDDTPHLEHPYGTASYMAADDYTDYDHRSATSTSRLRHQGSDPSISKTSSRLSAGEAWRRVSGGPAWEHKLSDKYLEKAPSTSKTVRYFDRSRQNRRVFLDCLWMWFGTALICAGLAAVLAVFEHISRDPGLSSWERYLFNTLINGLLLILGVAFAAQFKQYCEMMRWRFLTSSYRSLDEFDEVMGCDSWRSAIRLIFKRSKKTWYPNKSQLLAAAWVLIFSAFNVFAALLGLTYALEPSQDLAYSTPGQVSVLDLSNISGPEANFWGQSGSRLSPAVSDLREDPPQDDSYSRIYRSEAGDYWWYRFQDQNRNHTSTVLSSRTIKSSAICKELTLVPPDADRPALCNDSMKIPYYTNDQKSLKDVDCIISPDEPVSGLTTWITNKNWACGPGCMIVVVWQVATSADDTSTDGPHVTDDRLWMCRNTLGEVEGARTPDYDDPSDPALNVIGDPAWNFAGAIAWRGVPESGDPDEQSNRVLGDFGNPFNPGDNATNSSIAGLIMRFTMGAFSAIDSAPNYPSRTDVNGLEPSVAQVVNVEWRYARPILVGIPAVQLLMLVGVVLFSGKAIILEPSYLTVAHLLYPVMQKLGRRGMLMTVDEMSDVLGPDFKIAYAVRPSPNEPGQWDKEAVRDLGLVEESEGFGYIRGRMPEGRYD